MEPKSSSKLILDISILIAAITALLYCCSYEYEVAQFKYYKLPVYLIDLSIGTLVNDSIGGVLEITILAFTLYIIYYFLVYAIKINKLTSLNIVASINLLEVIIFFVLSRLDISSNEYICDIQNVFTIFGLLEITILIILLIAILLKIQVTKTTQPIDEPNHFNSIRAVIYSIYFITPLGFLTFSSLAGRSDAKNKEDYFVTGKTHELIILQKNAEYFIAKPYSKKNNKLSDSIIIYKISETQPLIMEFKHIGKLK